MAFRSNGKWILSLMLIIITLLIAVFQLKWERAPIMVQDHQPVKEETRLLTQDEVVDIFRYHDPGPAGSGTHSEELLRVRSHLATQQAVCQDIVRFGGRLALSNAIDTDPDGAWEVCMDPEVGLKTNSCIVYSIGISGDWSFDEKIEKQLGCEVFAFDPSTGKGDHQHSPKITFYSTGLSHVDSESVPGITERHDKRGWKMRTLDSIIKELGHSDKIFEILKMDIEGSEWESLSQMLASDSLRRRVKQLTIEYHLNGYTAESHRKYYGIMKWLERQGFLLFNKHQNDMCRQCLEMSYVNMNLVKLHPNNFSYRQYNGTYMANP